MPHTQPETQSPTMPSAEWRVERLFAIFVGCGYIGYIVLLYPLIVAQSSATAAWWTVVAVVLVFVPPLVLAGAAYLRRRVVARWAARATVFGFIIAATTWGLAWNGEYLDKDHLWFSVIPGLAALAAAITMSVRATLLVLVAAVLPAQIYQWLAHGDGYRGALLPDIAFALTFILLYVAAALMAMRTGRVLDATRADAYADAAAAAEADARRSQRSHVDGLLHDWVISTLLAAARQGNTDTVRRQALTTLDKLHSPPPEAKVMSATTARTRLRAAALAVDITGDVTATVGTTDARASRPIAPIPVEVVEVLDAAISESLRNSILHAGDDAARHTRIVVDADGIGVQISDDGVGFDPTTVPPHRLGLAVSILSRVRALPGGDAQVISAPGEGTIIRLRWEAGA